jgi:hypothetical protein
MQTHTPNELAPPFIHCTWAPIHLATPCQSMHADLETKQSDLGLACMSLWRRQFEWRHLLKVVHGLQFNWRHHASTTFHAPIHLPINTSTPSTLLPHHHSHYFFYNTSSTISSATTSCSFICTNPPTKCLSSQWANHIEERLQTLQHM